MSEKKIRRFFGADMRLYLPFFIVFLVSLAYHAKMHSMGGDDSFFAQALDNTSIGDYLVNRYRYWTSRVVLEGILVFIARVPWLWRILDCLAFATMPWLFANIADMNPDRFMDQKSDKTSSRVLYHWCAAGAALLFPFHDMGTAGWITTTETHFWPLWCILFLAAALKKILFRETIPIWMAAVSIPACIIAGSHEQYAVILAVLLILAAVCRYAKKRKQSKQEILPQQLKSRYKRFGLYGIWCAISILSLIVIWLCPGNSARNAVSLSDLPVYGTFRFFDKLYLGLLSIERVFIANADIVFFAFSMLLAVLVYLKTNHYTKTLISSLPFLILFGYTVIRTAFPGLSGLFPVPGEVLEWNWQELSTWIPMIYLTVTIAAVIFALYQIFGEDRLIFWYLLILLGCGFGSGAVIGFMATIYVSGERVYAAFYVILMLTAIAGIGKMEQEIQEKLKSVAGKLFVTFLGLLCLVNVGFLILSV